MAAEMRVFLVGVNTTDLAALRSHVRAGAAMRVVGEALTADLDAGHVFVPAGVDAVLMSREAAARRYPLEPIRADSAPERTLFEELTPRERDVLALLSDGHGNRTIAERLGVSEHTVKFHLTSIYHKLGASTRTEAVRRGLELGIIDI